MDNTNDERWLTDGKCGKCRRADYCSKKCTAHKRSMQNFLYDAIMYNTGLAPVYNELNRINEKGKMEYDERRRAMQYEKNKNNKNRKGRAKTC